MSAKAAARLVSPAAAALLACSLSASAQDLTVRQETGPTLEEAMLQPIYLQADVSDAQPGQSDVGTIARDRVTPPWYARGGLLLLFPQDVTFNGVTTVNVASDDPTDEDGREDVDVDQDVSLGWGGGLYAAVGYSFAPDARFNPRVEAEYQLLIDDYRDANDDGITWNSLGVNGIVDWRVRENMALYAGLGAGIAYLSTANPPVTLPSGALSSVGSDDSFTVYGQALGGALFRFSDDVDIDLGLKYQLTQPSLFEGDASFDNVVFHVGLLLHLE